MNTIKAVLLCKPKQKYIVKKKCSAKKCHLYSTVPTNCFGSIFNLYLNYQYLLSKCINQIKSFDITLLETVCNYFDTLQLSYYDKLNYILKILFQCFYEYKYISRVFYLLNERYFKPLK